MSDGGVYIFPDADSFLEAMECLQKEYNKKYENNDDGDDSE